MLSSAGKPPLRIRILAWFPFVASAALAAIAIDVAFKTPAVGLLLLAVLGALYVPRWLARQRRWKLLTSGDLQAVLAAWQAAYERAPHAATTVPLITATAFAVHGQTERARKLLQRPPKGAAWDAAIEHRLLLETLLEAFDGDRAHAIDVANNLVRLPLPPVGPFGQGHVRLLRDAIHALALAFAHEARLKHVRLMLRAARRNPLVYWPLCYAAAVVCLDHGDTARARSLLVGAPDWPSESVFQAFHGELLGLCTQSLAAKPS